MADICPSCGGLVTGRDGQLPIGHAPWCPTPRWRAPVEVTSCDTAAASEDEWRNWPPVHDE